MDVDTSNKARHDKAKNHIRNEIVFNLRNETTKYNIDEFFVNERLTCC